MIGKSYAEFVEEAAAAREQPVVPRMYIEQALERISLGLEDVKRYPNRNPVLRGVYDVATKLQAAEATHH